MYVQIKHSLAHLQDLIPTLAGVIAYTHILYQPKYGLNLVCRCARECFIYTFLWLHVFELTLMGSGL